MSMILSASHLLAVACGVDCTGPRRCFYCGAPADDSNPTSVHVKPTFTAFATAVHPGSTVVCNGCVLAMRDELDVPLLVGGVQPVARAAMRMFSWVITRDRAAGASRAHLAALREVCLHPPHPPYAVVLTDTGQTHQIYRGVVARSTARAVVTLECERIDYRPDDLAAAVELAGRLAACVGKPGLYDRRWSTTSASRIFARWRDADAMIDRWSRESDSPLSRLAAWLTPKMEDCKVAYPSDFD